MYFTVVLDTSIIVPDLEVDFDIDTAAPVQRASDKGSREIDGHSKRFQNKSRSIQ